MADNYLASYSHEPSSCKSCYYGTTGHCNNSSNYCLSSYDPSSCNSCYYATDPCNNSTNYDQIVVPFEHSFSYSRELNNPDLINYDNHLMISTQFDISHSSHSDPNLTHYYPINHGYSISSGSYLMNHISETETNHHVVAAKSVAVVVADDDDFLEYDPTPYGGGYDQILTYGEPLKASDKICHPRSSFSVDNPIDHDLSNVNPSPDNNSNNGGHDSSLGKPIRRNNKDGHEENCSEIVAEKICHPFDHDLSNVNPSPDNNNSNGGHDSSLGKPISREEDRRSIEDDHEENCFEIVAEKQFSDLGNGRIGEMGQFLPYGYGLEAMDLCESLFGYWPCLSKESRRKNQDQKEEVAEEEEEGYKYDQYWNCAQDYIFGSSSSPYG